MEPRMTQVIQRVLKHETFVSIFLIFLTTLITYGVSIPNLGYYHDDWFVLWSGQARGPESLIPLFSTDRPFMGVIYSVVYRLLGDATLNWHLYALLWRFIGGLAFFWIVRLVWPDQKYLTTVMTVLFLVYPGFLSQPNANTKQNHLFGFASALLSIALMFQALKTNHQGWKIVCSVLSLLLTANYLWIYEYMIGFEGTRFLLLGYVLFQDGRREVRSLVKEILKRIWPYWLITLGFLYWRVFVFEGEGNATDVSGLAGSYLSNFRFMSIRLILETLKDFLDTSVFAWFVQPYHLFSEAPYSNLIFALIVAAIVASLVWLYTSLFRKQSSVDDPIREAPQQMRDFLWIGALVTLFAILPVIASGRQMDLYDPYKSYGLHPIAGVILVITGLVLMLQASFRRWAIVALVLISVSSQVLNADYWERYWEIQRQMAWQLTWRAPDIQDDTLVMASLSAGFNPQQDYEVWGPINLIYNPGPAKAPPIQAEVLNSTTAYDILKKEVRNNYVRDIRLHRDFSNLLLITYPSSASWFHVSEGTLPGYAGSESLLVQQVGAFSRVDRIIPSGEAPIPPASIFGTEPLHGWCYYYQKASLARQAGNWEEIGRLYDETRELRLETDDTSEVIPFFEGLVNMGRYEDAKSLYRTEIKGQAEVRFPLCNILETNPGYPSEFGYNYKMINQILCNS
jgi:type IV secretory pathway VirB2 component (pilin)